MLILYEVRGVPPPKLAWLENPPTIWRCISLLNMGIFHGHVCFGGVVTFTVQATEFSGFTTWATKKTLVGWVI